MESECISDVRDSITGIGILGVAITRVLTPPKSVALRLASTPEFTHTSCHATSAHRHRNRVRIHTSDSYAVLPSHCAFPGSISSDCPGPVGDMGAGDSTAGTGGTGGVSVNLGVPDSPTVKPRGRVRSCSLGSGPGDDFARRLVSLSTESVLSRHPFAASLSFSCGVSSG